jgi:serine/threonine protein kinase
MKKTLSIKTKLSMFIKKTFWLLIFGAYFKFVLYKKYSIMNLKLFKFSDWHSGCNYFIGYSNQAKKKVFIKTSGRFNLADREIDVLEFINDSDKVEKKYFPKIIAYNKNGIVPFLAIEYINGVTLSEYISSSRLRDKNLDLKIIKELNHILKNLQQMSIIHRDIRPANIMISEMTGNIVLIDFAFAVSNENHDLGEVQIIIKYPNVAKVLGEEYKPHKLLWDDAYSIHKIAEKLMPEYSVYLPNEHQNILSKIGKITYQYNED